MSNDKNTKSLSTEEAWDLILNKYHVLSEIETNGVFHIKASQIKEFREPRLMSKWDSSEQLPKPLKENKINILPDSRSSYVLGDFLLYEDIPELTDNEATMTKVCIPEYESIDIDNIGSESNAINVMILSHILDDFLGEKATVETFNGRMGTGKFEFSVDTERKIKRLIEVNNAQCEIDGGFENDNSVVIMEAKNVVHTDFHVRQLYYPYRLWKEKVKKPIRLVFSVYSNKIFRLFEYEFVDENDYSSIRLVQSKNYSLEDTNITLEELKKVRDNTTVKYTDEYKKGETPFIQADSFDRVVSLLENIHDNPMNDEEIADLMGFGYNENNGKRYYRQSQYYFNAGKYLGLFERDKQQGEVKLSKIGNEVFNMKYKERQLKLVSLMMEHQIFAELFDEFITDGNIPDRESIMKKMRAQKVCGDPQIDRRARTVNGWLCWMLSLTMM